MMSVQVVFEWITVVVLVILSGSFSGLTLGLLGLNKTALEVILAEGNPKDKKNALRIYPLRKRGNLLLCTLLLGNVAVNALLPIILAGKTSGFIGFLLATAVTVAFGEILPQAVCARYGLWVGGHMYVLVYFFLIILFPVAYPISILLDKMLGEEMPTIYSANELKHLLDLHAKVDTSTLSKNDAKIMSGVLDLGRKTTREIMTPYNEVFMADVDSIVDTKFVTTVLEEGHSRIPIYEKNRNNIIGCLFVKDLALINPEDNTLLKTVLNFYGHPLPFTWDDIRLDELLSEFKRSESHMFVVRRVNAEGEGDPFYENVGIVTLEDLLEEILQEEIIDEYDQYIDYRSKQPVGRKRPNYRIFDIIKKVQAESELLPPQVNVIIHFLHGNVPEFSILPTSVINLIVSKAKIKHITCKTGDQVQFYDITKVTTNFSLILEGKVMVKAGKEGFVSQVGPFSYLGIGALHSENLDYLPDFSAFALTDTIILEISKSLYDEAVAPAPMTLISDISNENIVTKKSPKSPFSFSSHRRKHNEDETVLLVESDNNTDDREEP